MVKTSKAKTKQKTHIFGNLLFVSVNLVNLTKTQLELVFRH